MCVGGCGCRCRCSSEGQCNELFTVLTEACDEWHGKVGELVKRQTDVRNWKRKSETGAHMASLEDLRTTYLVRV